MSASPWAFHAHLAAWAVIAAVASLCTVLLRSDGSHSLLRVRRRGAGPVATPSATRRQWWQLAGALVTLAVALTWPVADLAARWSLSALLVQRMLLVLVVAPLLLLAMPVAVLGRLTRPAPIDVCVEFLSRTAVAIVVFTTVVVGTLVVPAVAAQASSGLWRGLFDAMLLFAGVVLWVPVVGRVPGARRPTPVGRAAYLVVQSVLPNFPAVVFVFSRHPLYPAFVHAHRAIALSALNDQQLAGILSKVGTLPVLWTAAWRSLARAEKDEHLGLDTEPLTWADVERSLERSERAERRSRARSASP